jgi:hypothetical protein
VRLLSAEKSKIILNEIKQALSARGILQSQRRLKQTFRCEGILIEDFLYCGSLQGADLLLDL